MFKCDGCQRITQPGERAERVPVELRKVQYQCVVKKIVKKGKREATTTRQFSTQGYEIVKEHTLCPTCAALYKVKRRNNV